LASLAGLEGFPSSSSSPESPKPISFNCASADLVGALFFGDEEGAGGFVGDDVAGLVGEEDALGDSLCSGRGLLEGDEAVPVVVAVAARGEPFAGDVVLVGDDDEEVARGEPCLTGEEEDVSFFSGGGGGERTPSSSSSSSSNRKPGMMRAHSMGDGNGGIEVRRRRMAGGITTNLLPVVADLSSMYGDIARLPNQLQHGWNEKSPTNIAKREHLFSWGGAWKCVMNDYYEADKEDGVFCGHFYLSWQGADNVQHKALAANFRSTVPSPPAYLLRKVQGMQWFGL